jgi:hypothetical protein
MTHRARLPEGAVPQRRGCFIEHVSLYRKSPNYPAHIFLHCKVDQRRLKTLVAYFRKHGGGLVVNSALYDYDLPTKYLEVTSQKLKSAKFLFIGVRLFKEQSNPRLQRFVDRMMPFLVYNKVADIKRQF